DSSRMVPFDPQTFIDQWWNEIIGKTKPIEGNNIQKSMSRSRKVIWKDHASEFTALKTLSGHTHLGRLFVDQIRYQSEMRAVAELYGPDPKSAVERLIGYAEITDAKLSETPGLVSLSKIKNTIFNPAHRARAILL
ncbi:hypothetical protein RZS08_19580, partial [Arthrospira platensis SPKY1]|nr:hypothetical protein [Arthrospira platensis SPKY1]